jgi:ribonuclease HI
VGNTAGSGVYSPNNDTRIAKQLPGYQNILRAELYAILLAIKNIKITQTDTHIFTDSLNSIYLINNHIQHPTSQHPTSQHYHPDKLLIAAIVRKIYWTPHKIYIHKVRAHTGITGNEIADDLANEGNNLEKPEQTPHIHIACPTPYWLASCPTCTHDGAIRNLRTFITKAHDNLEAALALNKFPYVDKWLSNTHINQKLSNHFWNNDQIPDTQITQTLKFRFAQYMGNHRKSIFWPLTHPNPNCTLCNRNERDTWPHLLSICEHPYLKGLRIARHNKAVHLITQTLQANKHTRFFTIVNAGHINNRPQETTVPEWLLACTCPQTPCQCQAKLRPDVLCMIGAPNNITLPVLPSSNHTIQFIEFTYCHDRFPDQAIAQKHAKYDPLNHAIHHKGWKINPVITITAGVRGAIHEHSIQKLTDLKIPKSNIKKLMKDIHQNAIKYLTYLVLNKRKLDNKQTPVPPP